MAGSIAGKRKYKCGLGINFTRAPNVLTWLEYESSPTFLSVFDLLSVFEPKGGLSVENSPTLKSVKV